MAELTRFGPLIHLRAESNQQILHFRRGRLVRKGAGISYWFVRQSAAVAQVPTEDIETTFAFREMSADFQEVHVQGTLRFRCSDPERLAARANFSISLRNGLWLEPPLEKLAALWAQLAQEPTSTYVSGTSLREVLRSGPRPIQQAVEAALTTNREVAEIGVSLVSVRITQVSPSPDLEKALLTPTREAIQQKADEASFERRAMAVEKERAIKQNELSTEIELARRQEDLIRQQGSNRLSAVQQDSEAERARVEAEAERGKIQSAGASADERVRAEGRAAAQKLVGEAEAEVERLKAEAWKGAAPAVVLGAALGRFLGQIKNIENLNITPDLLGETLRRALSEKKTD